ncbi:hypothetical protein [Pseudarthrobacter sulfonivorans]|uniref:hypothetical protein n=1 Tax=Pseudarthrobacter sulfonivorans TaxID=121292 RepID=UPI0027810395|nr:hypothetical protein [Pseudarthrobacter sulfonivorans]MDP9998282.1 hypothetical protein [Pseudarthrobacter sulfonivorans]
MSDIKHISAGRIAQKDEVEQGFDTPINHKETVVKARGFVGFDLVGGGAGDNEDCVLLP